MGNLETILNKALAGLILSLLLPKLIYAQTDSFISSAIKNYSEVNKYKIEISAGQSIYEQYRIGVGLTIPINLDTPSEFSIIKKLSIIDDTQKEQVILKVWSIPNKEFYYVDPLSAQISDSTRRIVLGLSSFDIEDDLNKAIEDVKIVKRTYDSLNNIFIEEQINPYHTEVIDMMKKHQNQIIWLTDFSLTSPDYDLEYTGIRFGFCNIYPKTLKYTTFSFQGYNAVDDKVGSVQELKCIGPVESYEFASYAEEFQWFTSIIEYAKLVSIKFQFMDNSTKTINKNADFFYSEEIEETYNKYEKWEEKYRR